MPQFWAEYFSPQLVWLVISFAVLYVLMAKVALPRVADVLEGRQDRIASDLDQAKQLQEQAEKVIAQYESALAEARSEAQGMLAQVAAEAKAKAEQRNTEVAERLHRESSAASERIEAAKTEALSDLQGVARDIAQAAAERLIGADVPSDEVAQAVDRAMQQSR